MNRSKTMMSVDHSSSHQRLLPLLLLLLAVGLAGCSVSRYGPEMTPRLKPFPGYKTLSPAEREMADSMLTFALDHEALYSLIGDIKSISQTGFIFADGLGKDSTDLDGQAIVVSPDQDSIRHFLDALEQWNRITKALSFGPYQFIIVPFRHTWNNRRHFQITVCRTDLIDRLLSDRADFFAQWGFVSGTDPAVLVTAAEFEDPLDRYRAYGYLFGYPKHAVDFFVEAAREEKRTGEFVQRDFFQIPVHAKSSGYFTYAVPKGYQPVDQDSSLYYQGGAVLDKYRAMRPRYVDKNGRLNAVRLLKKYWKNVRHSILYMHNAP